MDQFPSAAMREVLSTELNASMRQIQVWFQNRRQREKLQAEAAMHDPTLRIVRHSASAAGCADTKVTDLLRLLQSMPAARSAEVVTAQIAQARAQLAVCQQQTWSDALDGGTSSEAAALTVSIESTTEERPLKRARPLEPATPRTTRAAHLMVQLASAGRGSSCL
jgi:hypothetical protein|eukprot:Transcript_13477.p2 GENE.Transcript_13477~~Transcript_13477.p2  ORF type:complete len:165 (-),score=29.12 Transcript_13477:42-536(-)